MGIGILEYCKKKLTREQKQAFVMTFCFTLLVHMYKFTNTLLNHDSLYNVYDTQNILGSGRWALQAACGFSSYYDLPWVIGILCCVFLGLTAAVVVTLFRIKNPVLIFLCGGLLAASPATTETFFFQFTADGYMIAMFLASLAIWFSRLEEKRISRYLFSGICLCVCCGIYQAYVSYALVLAVCYFIHELFLNREEKRAYLQWVLRQVLIFGLAVVVYYIIWKWCLALTGTPASSYQGISDVGVGSITPALLVHGLKKACRYVADYFLQLATLRSDWPLYTVLNVLLLAALAGGLVLAWLRSGMRRRPWALVLVLLCLVAIVPFAGIWCFTSELVVYRPMMLQGLTMVFLLTGVLYEQWAKDLMKNAVGLLLTVIVLNNALLANISYFYMNVCYERTYADGLEMMMKIHDIQDEEVFWDVAVIGDRYNDFIWKEKDPDTGLMTKEGEFNLLSCLLEENLLVSYHTIQSFLSWYQGTDIVLTSGEKTEALKAMEVVQNMPVWPAEGSMRVIDGTLVIKLMEKNDW